MSGLCITVPGGGVMSGTLGEGKVCREAHNFSSG